MKIHPLPLLLPALLAAVLHADVPIPDNPLSTLRPEHPRIFATAADFARLKETIKTDSVAGNIAQSVIRQADDILNESPAKYIVKGDGGLLKTSRKVKDRIQTLGIAWQLTAERKYAERAWKELEEAGNFPDWHPPHFLDTAEMTRAFAVGLDWMFDAWTPEQREQLCQWVITKGFAPAMAGYSDPNSHNGHQLRALNNWGQVCNGGVGTGALAIADLHPKEAREALCHALKNIQISLGHYAADGSWDEGYAYFVYAMEFMTGFISSLENSLGTDFGFSRTPGFSSTPDYATYIEGPCGNFFGFADCEMGEKKIKSIPYVGWVAIRYGNMIAAAAQRAKAEQHPDALSLLWLPPAAEQPKISEAARVKGFTASSFCTMRTKWGDPKAGFVGFKAGDNKGSHGHLDIGSFVYDAGGTHWAVDLGADSYNLPNYFSRKDGWVYYRKRAEGNNTLVVNPSSDPDQSPTAQCPLTLCADRGNASVAVGDLGAAYPQLASAKRGVRLANDSSLRIQDELNSAGKEASVLWFMHTPAAIEVSADRRSATLSQNGKTLRAVLVSPSDARFEVMPASPLPTSPNPPGQAENKGITKLAARSTFKGNETLVVDLIPEGVMSPAASAFTPLANW